jgi:hypothetical protein
VSVRIAVTEGGVLGMSVGPDPSVPGQTLISLSLDADRAQLRLNVDKARGLAMEARRLRDGGDKAKAEKLQARMLDGIDGGAAYSAFTRRVAANPQAAAALDAMAGVLAPAAGTPSGREAPSIALAMAVRSLAPAAWKAHANATQTAGACSPPARRAPAGGSIVRVAYQDPTPCEFDRMVCYDAAWTIFFVILSGCFWEYYECLDWWEPWLCDSLLDTCFVIAVLTLYYSLDYCDSTYPCF